MYRISNLGQVEKATANSAVLLSSDHVHQGEKCEGENAMARLRDSDSDDLECF